MSAFFSLITTTFAVAQALPYLKGKKDKIYLKLKVLKKEFNRSC